VSRPAVVIMGAAVRPGGEPSRALRERVQAALAWGERQDPPALYIPTGAVGRHGPAESEVMSRLLRDAGVPLDRIVQEPTGTDTLSSVRACLRVLDRLEWEGEVRVATHGFHLPRTLTLFRLGGRPASAVPPPGRALARNWYWRLREVPGFPYDAALMAWARLRGRL
jgi:vancomycin permeability regulator SanA